MANKKDIKKDITIEPDIGGPHSGYSGQRMPGFWAVEHGVEKASSVRAGLPYRQLLKHYDTVADALKDYPDAEVIDHSSREWTPPNQSLADASGLPKAAPGWFDPADAGESWDDDY